MSDPNVSSCDNTVLDPFAGALRISDARQGGAEKRASNWPLHLDIDINHSCNSQCHICYRSTSLKQKDGRMAWYLYKKMVLEGAEHGLASLNLDYGGEPLLKADINKFIAFARDHGIPNVMFHTNGALLSSDVAAKIMDAGLTRITISLDALTKEVYKRQRDCTLDFDRITDNVLGFIEMRNKRSGRIPFIQLSFVVTSINKHEKDLFYQRWHELVDEIHFRDFNNPGFELDPTLHHRNLTSKHLLEIKGKYYCTMLNWRLSIRWDGIAFPCCHPNGLRMPIGDVRKKSIHEIWMGRSLKNIRSNQLSGHILSLPGCRMCMKDTGLDGNYLHAANSDNGKKNG